jgi:acyl carrier protein
MTSPTRVEQQIRHFVLENFMYTSDEGKLKNDDSFLDQGIIDSTGILELLMFVEETFGIEVQDEEVLPENFDSVDRLARYIREKTGETVVSVAA